RVSTACQEAAKCRRDMPEFHSKLGNVWREMGNLDESEQACRQAIALHGQWMDPWCNLSATLKAQARLQEAAEAAQRAIEFAPPTAIKASACISMGNVRMAQGHAESAAEALQQAVAASPTDALAHNNLGNALRELGRVDD